MSVLGMDPHSHIFIAFLPLMSLYIICCLLQKKKNVKIVEHSPDIYAILSSKLYHGQDTE